jgi:multicomponent Na+:H+ antiporter subunit B
MDALIRTVARIMFPFILTFGIYIAFHGHLSPGGGFPAGVIIASAFILLIIAYPKERVKRMFSESAAVNLKSLAGIGLTLIIVFGFLIRTRILNLQHLFNLWSGGYTIFLNIIGAVMVATALVMIIYAFAGGKK